MANKYLDALGLAHFWSKLKAHFVAKEAGKGLSTNDYTAADKAKVDKITTTGDGTSYLSNDGTYKAVESGGVVLQATAPDNTAMLWIDTSNDNIAKYYNTDISAWTAIPAVWG